MQGLVVTIVSTYANTKFTDAGTLKLRGNLNCTLDDTLALAFDGANWFEISRSAN